MLNLIKRIIPSDAISILSNAKNSAITFFFSASLSFIASVMVSNVLGPEGRGVLTWMTSLLLFGTYVSLFGLNNVNSQLSAESVKNVHNLVVLSVFTTLIAYVLVSPVIFQIWHNNPIAQSHMPLYLLMVLMIPIAALTSKIQSIVLGLRLNRAHNYIIFVEKAVYGIVCLILVYVGLATPNTIWITFAVTLFIGLIIGMLCIRRHYDIRIRNSLKQVMQKLEGVEKFTLYSYISSLLTFSTEIIMVTLCAKHAGVAGLGILSVARSIMECIFVVFEYFTSYTRTQLSSDPNIRHRIKVHAVMVAIVSTSAIAVAITLYILAPYIITLLFQSRFPGADKILQLFTLYFAISVTNSILSVLFRTIYKNILIVIQPAIFFVTGILTSTTLIPRYGMEGVVYSLYFMGTAVLLCAIINYIYVLKQVRAGRL